ncbi:MAG: AAA family ATPase [Deltaproteobacteria bacterium]|nr:AAA family ATPase [Deltaproteobacteria bacterium]
MLASARIQGFKSLADVSVELRPINVLFGPNAAGKSNLIEALLLLSRLITERTVGEALGPPLRGYPVEAFSLPRGGLSELLGTPAVHLEIEGVVRPGEPRGARFPLLKYRVGVEMRPGSGEARVIDEYLGRMTAAGELEKNPRVERVDGGRLAVRRLQEQGQPRHETLPLHHTVVSNLQFSGEKYPDFDHLRDEVSRWRSYYLDPAGAMRTAQPPREVDDVGANGEHLAPFLYRLKGGSGTLPAFKAVQRALHAALPSVTRLDVDLDPQRGTLDIRLLQNGTEFSSRVVSEGTLRVLTLCAIAANPFRPSLIALEEPENGVHPRRLEVIAGLLVGIAERGTQVMVTTHSPAFVAEMLRAQRRAPEKVQLLRCANDRGETSLCPFEDPSPLFENKKVAEALRSDDDLQQVQGMLVRGWLDD